MTFKETQTALMAFKGNPSFESFQTLYGFVERLTVEEVVRLDVAYHASRHRDEPLTPDMRRNVDALTRLCAQKIDARLGMIANTQEPSAADLEFLVALYKSNTFHRRLYTRRLTFLAKAEAVLRDFVRAAKNLAAENLQMKQVLEETAETVTTISQENSALQGKLSAADEVYKQEISKRAQFVKELEEVFTTSVSGLEEVRAKNDELERALAEKESEIEEMRKEVLEKDENQRYLLEKMRDIIEQVLLLSTACEDRKNKAAQLETEVADLKEKLESMESFCLAVTKERNYMRDFLTAETDLTRKLKATCHQQAEELQTMKKKMKPMENLNEQAEELFKMVEDLKLENAALKRKVQSAQESEQMKAVMAVIENLKTQIELCDEHIETLMDDKVESSPEVEPHTERYVPGMAEFEQESEEIAALKVQIVALETQVVLRDQYIETLLDDKVEPSQEFEPYTVEHVSERNVIEDPVYCLPERSEPRRKDPMDQIKTLKTQVELRDQYIETLLEDKVEHGDETEEDIMKLESEKATLEKALKETKTHLEQAELRKVYYAALCFLIVLFLIF